jgi:YidC/Oxa1 family membrane protein insertase
MNIPALISSLSVVLWPIKWVIELLLVGFHWVLTTLGMDPAAGITWILSILGLVIVVRSALIPVTLRMFKSQRKMMAIAPQIKKIQDKYKGKKDQYSREAMSRETMALYKNNNANPLSSCLPLLIQMPVFLSLTATLTAAQSNKPVVGLLGLNAGVGGKTTLAELFGKASLFNVAPLHDTLQEGFGRGIGWVIGIAIGMIILMSATQFVTQLQIMSKNQTPEMKASPTYRQQRILLYILPFIFIFSGFTFPLGVMFYWVFGNLWTMGQQFIIIRNMPNPGSDAALAKEARVARKRQRRPQIATEGATSGGGIAGFSIVEEPKKVSTQRSQPVSKNRAKKGGNRK